MTETHFLPTWIYKGTRSLEDSVSGADAGLRSIVSQISLGPRITRMAPPDTLKITSIEGGLHPSSPAGLKFTGAMLKWG